MPRIGEIILALTRIAGLIELVKALVVLIIGFVNNKTSGNIYQGVTMADEVGTKNISELVLFAFSLVNTGWAIGKDKKLDASDLATVFGSAPALVTEGVAAFTGLSELPKEFKDLSAEEAASLVAEVMLKCSVDDVKAKAIIEASLEILPGIVKLVKACIA